MKIQPKNIMKIVYEKRPVVPVPSWTDASLPYEFETMRVMNKA